MKKILILAALPFLLYANKIIVVDLSKQKAFAKENGKIVYKGRISSGRVNYETPNGIYKITEKKIAHKSTIYPKPNGGGPMNYMMRLNGSSYALHLGDTPGFPASSGCVRLSYGFAQKVYKWAEVGTTVQVIGSASKFKGLSKKEAIYGAVIDKDMYPGDSSINRMNVPNDEMY